MAHDRTKNRAVCVFAKTSVWGLRALTALTLLSLIAIMAVGFVLKILKDGGWEEFRNSMIFLAVLAVATALLTGIVTLIIKWYEWAKRYAREC